MITQRIFVNDTEEQVVVKTLNENLNMRVFVNSDPAVSINVDVGDVTPCTDDIVVMNFPLRGVTGTGMIDITAYSQEFYIAVIIFTPTSGVPVIVQAGWSAGTDEVLFSTDVSYLSVDDILPINTNVVPGATDTEVHFTMLSGTWNIDVVMIRRRKV